MSLGRSGRLGWLGFGLGGRSKLGRQWLLLMKGGSGLGGLGLGLS